MSDANSVIQLIRVGGDVLITAPLLYRPIEDPEAVAKSVTETATPLSDVLEENRLLRKLYPKQQQSPITFLFNKFWKS